MKRWKSIATVLSVAAGLSGAAWAQQWGQQGRDHDGDKQYHRDRDDRRRDHDRDDWRKRRGDHDRDDYYRRNGNWGYYPNNNGGYYPNNGGYYPAYPNRGWGWGNNPGWGYQYPGTYGYYGNGSFGAAQQAAYQQGYNDGRSIGARDRRAGLSYRVGDYKAYKNASGPNRDAYRNGWVTGYRQGYGAW